MAQHTNSVRGVYAPPSRPSLWAAFLVALVLSLGFLGVWAIWSLMV